MYQDFELEFFGFDEQNVYSILSRLDSIAKTKTLLGHFIKDNFEDALLMKNTIDKLTLDVIYPIDWPTIIELYPYIQWIAIDHDGEIYAYEHKPVYDPQAEMWLIKPEDSQTGFLGFARNRDEEDKIGAGWPSQNPNELIFKRPS